MNARDQSAAEVADKIISEHNLRGYRFEQALSRSIRLAIRAAEEAVREEDKNITCDYCRKKEPFVADFPHLHEVAAFASGRTVWQGCTATRIRALNKPLEPASKSE
jgi:hypothetical protein